MKARAHNKCRYLLSKRALILTIILLIEWQTVAQPVEVQHVVKYTQKNGLTSYNIRNIIKDKWGFLWIATQDGLNRFDGNTFVTYTKNAVARHRVCGVDIRQIIEDTVANIIWVLPGEFGLNAINTRTGEVIQTIPIPYKDPEEWWISMVRAKHKLWIGTSVGIRIYNITTRKFEADPDLPVASSDNLDKFETRSLCMDIYGNIWAFFSGYGIVIYQQTTGRIIKTITLSRLNDYLNRKNIRFTTVTANANGQILAGTDQGLRMITYTDRYDLCIDNNPSKIVLQLNKEPIESLRWLDGDKLLVASHSNLFQLNGRLDNALKMDEPNKGPDGQWLNAVQAIYSDKTQNIWLGCQQGLGFIGSNQHAFTSYSFDGKTHERLDHVRSIYPLNCSTTLIGLRNGMAIFDQVQGHFSIIDKTHLFHHIFQDKGGKVWASRQDGLFILRHQQLVGVSEVYPEFTKFKETPINSHLFFNDSLLVMGTENNEGILIWNYKAHCVTQLCKNTIGCALPANIVNNIYKDSKGRLWVLSDNVISVISNNLRTTRQIILTDHIPGQKTNLFFDMCEANDCYWIAAYGSGIIQLDCTYKIKHIYNSQSGLSNDGVYQIFPEKGSLLITSNDGLSVFDLKALKFRNYYEKDGLHSSAFEEVAGVSKNGLIYAGGVNGFTIIDPSKFTVNVVPPKVYINRITIERYQHRNDIDTSDLLIDRLEIPNDVLQTSLHFSGINFNNPQHTYFSYLIKEINGTWIDIKNQSFIDLIGLSPGTYHLEIKALNEDQLESTPVLLTLIYLPHWYQTWWFRILLLLCGFGIGYIVYKVRINQLLKQQKIRRDVASDLHDDIGSSLNSVKVFAHLARTNPSKTEYIHHVEENLEQATMGLRDMIWILDDKLDTVADLCNRLRQVAARSAEALGIAVHFNEGDGADHTVLSKPQKRNLFLIAKEAVNNCVKYAGCRNVWVTFKKQAGKQAMTIRDDGKGFDTKMTSAGYGLTNMKSRSEQIHFQFDIQSGSDGTLITLTED